MQEDKGEKKIYELKVFPVRVPFALEEFQENITITTTSKPSKEEIINQAFKLHSEGNISEAAKYYQYFIDQGFNNPSVLSNYGMICRKKGNIPLAKKLYLKSIALYPNFSASYSNLGFILKEENDLKGALKYIQKARDLNPDFAEAHYNLGNVLKDLGKLKEAELSTRKAIELNPDYAEAHSNLGGILKDLGELQDAELSIRKAIDINPVYAHAHLNLGDVLKCLGKSQQAEVSTRKAIELNPDLAKAHSNLGAVLKDLGKLKDAEISFRKAIEIKPDFADAHNNLAHLLLTSKIFEEGWERYEWRWEIKSSDSKFKLKTNNPRWNQEQSGCVLLWGEQGIGDQILYLSLVPDCIDKVEKIILKLDKRLIPLLKRSIDKSIEIIGMEDSIDEKEYDYHLPIGSLPKFLRPSLNSFKTAKKLKLEFDKDRSTKFRKQLLHKKYKKYIGISWKSTSKDSLINSITLEEFITGIYSKDICFINLQYGDVKDEINDVIAKLGIEIYEIDNLDIFNDIDGLASLIGSCDEVVTIGNVTATLSGSLNINTKVILPTNSYWPYGLKDKKSYWFSSMKLYKQTQRNIWDDTLNKIKKEIMI